MKRFFVALQKPTHLYSFLWGRVEDAPQLLQHLGTLASDPELDFTWADALTVSQKIHLLTAAALNGTCPHV